MAAQFRDTATSGLFSPGTAAIAVILAMVLHRGGVSMTAFLLMFLCLTVTDSRVFNNNTFQPTSQPSCHPTSQPSSQPTSQPTRPSSQPTSQPTYGLATEFSINKEGLACFAMAAAISKLRSGKPSTRSIYLFIAQLSNQ